MPALIRPPAAGKSKPLYRPQIGPSHRLFTENEPAPAHSGGMNIRPSPLSALRDAKWLAPEAARIYRMMLALLLTGSIIGWIVFSRMGLDPFGKPLGTDFLSFWTASQLALGGNSAAPYDPALHNAAQLAQFNAGQGYAAFFYPPPYLLLCLPLALLPYLPSLALWLALTGAAYARVVFLLLDRCRNWWLTLLAFPAILMNMGHGQNAFLTAALMGGGLMLLPKRPWIAGALFGCLVIKPHLALLVPIALAARGEWRAFMAAGLTAALLCLLSLVVLGPQGWAAFVANAPLARHTLEAGLVDPAKMVSTFAAVRVLGGSVALGYAIQAVATLGVIATLILMARARLAPAAQNAALAAGAMLATPFVLDYDLSWLAIPLAFAFVEARRTGFLPYEKVILAAAFVLPLFARSLALAAHLPIAPLVLAALFWAVIQRGLFVRSSPCRR
mgnify:CR=1 FL=1